MFLVGANLRNEDGFTLDLLSDSMKLKEGLKIVRDMKEEGNSFFALEKFDDALERYGYAEIILVNSKFKEEDDKIEMWNLSPCILQNISAYFSRLKEFEQVGQICITILDFHPKNVKAMYRRAMAAIGLERHEWALLEIEVGCRD
ncbi:70 kDa peptidyl-prolyl isomerase [Bienertia sinuspersici]